MPAAVRRAKPTTWRWTHGAVGRTPDHDWNYVSELQRDWARAATAEQVT
jgi:hypothetical protein